MKKQIAGLLLCLLTLLHAQKCFAYQEYECEAPCFNSCRDLTYYIGADYLYWTATRPEDNSIFAGFPVRTTFLQPNYQSGYRVAAALYYNNVDFEARYTSLHSDTSLRNHPTFALTYQLDYQTVDLAFGYTHFFSCHRAYLKPYLGAKLSWLKDHTTAFLIPERNATLTTNAYGPMLGIEGAWELFRCWLPISLIARGDLSTLFGSFAYTGTLGGSAAPIYLSKAYSFITVQDIFLGLSFDFCNFSCFDANLQIGYEAQLWNGMRAYSASNDFRNAHSALGLGGLVVHLGAMF